MRCSPAFTRVTPASLQRTSAEKRLSLESRGEVLGMEGSAWQQTSSCSHQSKLAEVKTTGKRKKEKRKKKKKKKKGGGGIHNSEPAVFSHPSPSNSAIATFSCFNLPEAEGWTKIRLGNVKFALPFSSPRSEPRKARSVPHRVPPHDAGSEPRPHAQPGPGSPGRTHGPARAPPPF